MTREEAIAEIVKQKTMEAAHLAVASWQASYEGAYVVLMRLIGEAANEAAALREPGEPEKEGPPLVLNEHSGIAFKTVKAQPSLAAVEERSEEGA